MNCPYWKPLVSFSILSVAICSGIHASQSVFVLANSGGKVWRGTEVRRFASAEIFVEQTFEQTGNLDRVVVVRSTKTDAAADDIKDFARTLKQLFAPGSGPEIVQTETHRLGRDGRELHFIFIRDQQTFNCELFVFQEEKVNWGILCARLVSEGDASLSMLDLLQQKPAAPSDVVLLAPFKVTEDAVSAFPISFRILANRADHRVVHLIVNEAPPKARSGLAGNFKSNTDDDSAIEVGDEIIAIDGRPSHDFDASMGRDTELGRIFLNRHPDEEVKLQLISARTHTPFEVTLRVSKFLIWNGR